MNIAIFATSHLPFVGGSQIAVDEITKRLPEHKFFLFCPRLSKNLPKNETINNTVIFRLGIGRNIDKYLFIVLGPLLALRTVGSRAMIWAIMFNYGGLGALVYHYLTFKRNRFVLTLQEAADKSYFKKQAGLFYFLIKPIFLNATHIQAISKFTMSVAREIGYKGNNYSIIPNGVDIVKFRSDIDMKTRTQLMDRYNIPGTARVLFTASRLSAKNAIGDVIDALHLLPAHYIFIIAGSGEQEGLIRSKIDTYKLADRVHLLGDIAHEEIVRILNISHIFIRPSLREGLGNAFLEAMATGLPVVATPVGGINDFLVHEETGIAVEPKNIESIKNGILAYEDNTRYQRIRANGLKMVSERFTWDIVAKEMNDIFKQVLTHPHLDKLGASLSPSLAPRLTSTSLSASRSGFERGGL
ncbi:MAG: glycosyltransferase family 4 protein [Fibrobacterota bacterium]